MAQNIFEQYGIKEVADVQFEALEDNDRLGIRKGDVVLYLDTLKVSTIETTADSVDATGGKGNVSLISWDYGREVTLTLTDALFTPASLAVMMGGKGVEASTSDTVTVRFTQDIENFTANTTTYEHDIASGVVVKFIDTTKGIRGLFTTSAKVTAGDKIASLVDSKDSTLTVDDGDTVKLFYDTEVGGTGTHGYKITIDSQNFPGTYKVYGDTLVRDTNGSDTAFQFVIPKAKINSEVTLTMEAEGDPTTFDMSLKVLRAANHEMFQLIKYDFKSDDDAAAYATYYLNDGTNIVGSYKVRAGSTIAKDEVVLTLADKSYYKSNDAVTVPDTPTGVMVLAVTKVAA